MTSESKSGESQQIFRVTVRGRFADLTEKASTHLVANQHEHDIFVSAYTPEGTFTYDDKIDFFNLRYEVRAGGLNPSMTAHDEALIETELFLTTMGFGFRDLKVTVTDMNQMMDGTRSRD